MVLVAEALQRLVDPNTGGGGGAAHTSYPSGTGGSGVVILRYPSAYSISETTLWRKGTYNI